MRLGPLVDPATRGLALRIVWSPDAAAVDRVFDLGARGARIGRDPRVGRIPSLALEDPSISRLHARIKARTERGGFVIQDRGSSNGVLLNGRRVDSHALSHGDVIRLGDTLMVVCEPPWAGDDGDDLAIAGHSALIAELRALIRRVGPSHLSVMIQGATGTGKELVAQALHAVSGRRGPFLAVNCAALPGTLVEDALFGHKKGAYTDASSHQDGAFVRANEGTLFLDEIGDLSLEAQPKLLRALETREVLPIGATEPVSVDLRIVVATHVALDTAVAEGRFREDLYARLAGVALLAPRLVDRREDILYLMGRFLPEEIRARPLDPDVAEALLLHSWPRNVRELQMLAERLQTLHPGEPFRLNMLDDEMAGAVRARAVVATEPERRPGTREELVNLLERCGGNVARLAKLVQRNRKQVYRWMDEHGVTRGYGRS